MCCMGPSPHSNICDCRSFLASALKAMADFTMANATRTSRRCRYFLVCFRGFCVHAYETPCSCCQAVESACFDDDDWFFVNHSGSNLPGFASQFANQVLGTVNQLWNAEQKVRIKKIICEAVQSMHRTRFAAACAIAFASTSSRRLVQPRRSPAPVLNSRRVVYCW